MSLFSFARRDRVRSASTSKKTKTRNTRAICPTLESVERRELMSGATISGTVFRDIAGNGAFSDVSPLTGVTVNLYQSGSTKVFEQLSSDSNGNFSFKNLAPGSYTVQQVVPTSYLPTGALYGYPVTVTNGQTAPGKDFEDYQLTPLPTLTNLSYIVTTPGGKHTTVTKLNGNVEQGDKVTANFTLATPSTMTLVAYSAPNGNFNTSNLQQQVIFSEANITSAVGKESLTVTVPNGYFQLDFVAGHAIDHLETNSNVSYQAQDRLIDHQDGGTQPDTLSVITPVEVAVPETVPQRKH